MNDGIRQSEKIIRRRSAKRSRIVLDLRKQILEGEFAPGSRLPTRSDLEQRFGVSSVTVQRAIDQLIEDGFIYARHRQGTFVAEHPPHLTHYGLVLPSRPSDAARWSRFFGALCNEAKTITSDPPRQISVYYGMEDRASTDFARLRHDLESRRLVGLIFGNVPNGLMDESVLGAFDVPRVGVMIESDYGMPAVYVDYNSFLKRALEYLNTQYGRRRVAFLLFAPLNGLSVAGEGYALGVPSHWIQYSSPLPAEAARNCVELLMRGPAHERPDALVIANDNLVEQATAGLLAAGVRVPEDVAVVAHCNFPWPTPSLVPAKRLGFDARTIIERCLEVLDMQRKHQSPPALTLVPAVFEDEFHR